MIELLVFQVALAFGCVVLLAYQVMREPEGLPRGNSALASAFIAIVMAAGLVRDLLGARQDWPGWLIKS